MGLLTPKTNSSKKPITVGGKTRGNVNMPSKNIFVLSDFIFTIHLAAIIPRKNVKTMAADADVYKRQNLRMPY